MNPSNPLSLGSVQLLDDALALSLDELCRACDAQSGFIVELVQEGLLTPDGPDPSNWRFSGTHLLRARVALRLHSDLGVNPAGAALALQLLDEVQELRAKLAAGVTLRR
ncbi:MAG: chaperone modulator CbpM [Betaproteobacteria bacterium]